MNTSTVEKRGIDWLMRNKYCKAAWNNLYAFDWECDVFGVTKSYITHEIEVKTSKSDFMAEFRNKKGKHYKTKYGQGCNHFWFAVPSSMKDYAMERLPEFAGLLVAREGLVTNPMYVAMKAPQLHNEKLKDLLPDFWESIAMKQFYKHTSFGI